MVEPQPFREWWVGRRTGMMHAIAVVKTEPEAPGPMPLGLRIRTMLFPASTLRSAIRATKRSIACRIEKAIDVGGR
ncbi:MAG TPA: hypothetical protein PLO69_11145 [Gammaproteobacteria bacterium]|nr:hypothetical protein [Gammaproteobacteria bacterium]